MNEIFQMKISIFFVLFSLSKILANSIVESTMAKIIDRQQQQQQQSKNSSITYRIELYDDDNINRLIERPLQSRVFVVHIDRQSDNDGNDNKNDGDDKINVTGNKEKRENESKSTTAKLKNISSIKSGEAKEKSKQGKRSKHPTSIKKNV